MLRTRSLACNGQHLVLGGRCGCEQLRHRLIRNMSLRELENVIERAVVLCNEPRIETKHLPAAVVPQAERDGSPPIPGSTIHDLERYAILKTLEACGGSTSKAAMILGVSTRKIQYKLHEYGAPEGTAEPPVAGPVTVAADAAAMRGGLPLSLGNGHGGLEDGFGLAVIAELADDVRISRTSAGLSVCMSWPSSV